MSSAMQNMYYETITTNDNTKIAYQTSLPTTSPPNPNTLSRTCILLLHSFSGSSAYFTRNILKLSESHWVIAPDMRGHGQSQQTKHGYHIARLAADLHELITHVIHSHNPKIRIYAVGCSIGAAVLWTYTELFTDHDFAGLVFVDQAPLQDRSVFGGGWGEGLAHYGCFDEATTIAAQKAWSSNDANVREATYVDLVRSCLGYRYAPGAESTMTEEQSSADEEFFTSISRVCDGVWLARLLADHTRYDHREAIEAITKPVLVMMGAKSGCFSVEGMRETVRRARSNRNELVDEIVFDSGHWLFWEEPEKFNRELLGFVERCEKHRWTT